VQEKQQPHEERRDAKKSIRHFETHGTFSENTRRQWSPTNGSRERTCTTVRPVRIRGTTYCKHRGFRGSDGISSSLQNRLWSSSIEDSDRSRRKESWCIEETGPGQPERHCAEWIGVDRVEILKREDLERDRNSSFDGYVYNIEVEGLHTYVANDIVVHNCHHVLTTNKWGKAFTMFPNAKALLVTATPCRADGKGLGAEYDGVVNRMVEGPTMRWLIDNGYLSDYRIICPPSNLDLSEVDVSADGDYNKIKLRTAVQKSSIMGDVVEHYLRIAPNKLGITFAPGVDIACEMAAKFNAAGVPTEIVSGKTESRVRAHILERFRRRELLMLVNVDLFGEGFDLPARLRFL